MNFVRFFGLALVAGALGSFGCSSSSNGGTTVTVKDSGADTQADSKPADSGTTTTDSSTTAETGTDCASQANFQACAQCFAAANPTGAQKYNDLLDCVFCQACYTSCDGANSGCSAAPASKDACDTATAASSTACGGSTSGCVKCALAGTCATQQSACAGDASCVQFNKDIQTCPTN